LPEDIRRALNDHNIPLATRSDREELERFHFDIAVSRATSRLFLSWPAHNEKGEPNLRSFALDTFLENRNLASSQLILARPLRIRPSRPAAPAPRPALQSEEILHSLRAIHARLAATAIESYLQCPFQFFARHTLRLEPLPPLPAERLDPRFHGQLAHAILSEWHKRGGSIESLTEESWDRQLLQNGLTESYQSLLGRAIMKRCLRAYAADASLGQPRPGWQIVSEEKLQCRLSGVEIHGRADRVDISPEGDCVVYDFKYSATKPDKAREEITVQGGLYAYALHEQKSLHPVGIHIIPLKKLAKNSESKKKEDPPQDVDAIIAAAKIKAENAIGKIFSGRIDVLPAIPDLCQYCDFRDACRRHEQAAVQFAAGGGEEGGEEV
jgi:RecB family exonuclease